MENRKQGIDWISTSIENTYPKSDNRFWAPIQIYPIEPILPEFILEWENQTWIYASLPVTPYSSSWGRKTEVGRPMYRIFQSANKNLNGYPIYWHNYVHTLNQNTGDHHVQLPACIF
ncbi:hypothetical protein M3O96_09365 [Aquiflexum sp. TKW24L]|uniref:hypothetical protein n=1 Tax=Aquiflexum sp. TKW24L TaxID=2942212 RepID=UPI0020C08253|nr:hypothetical protein [Aquiflexum sp. TKW24L]MCL6259295.1 hypothetical protein [Aquiflexum sp. TKW24L]